MRKSVLGILGTAKNTGKTTTTTALLKHAGAAGLTSGITSIGYDGEDLDTITELPKPRIAGKAGTFIATAKRCLEAGTAGIQVIRETDCLTPLGRIVIGRITEEGLVVLAGPNKGRDLRAVIGELKKCSCSLVLVDGALNRIVPLMQTDALIITTGASRNTSADFLAREVQSIHRLFALPRTRIAAKTIGRTAARQRSFLFIDENGGQTRRPGGSLVQAADAEALLAGLRSTTLTILIPGILKESALEELIRQGEGKLAGKRLVFQNPANLLIGNDPLSLCSLLDEMEAKGIRVELLESPPVLAVTVNPFYPLYNRFGDGKYQIAWVNREELYRRVREAVSVPVLDIVHEGGGELFTIVARAFSLPPA